MNQISKQKTWYNFVTLFFLYVNLVIFFALLYWVVEWANLGFILDHYASAAHQKQWSDRITRTLYFSAITLLSVGYGDLSPFGWARGVAILEALIGYVLPGALVIRYVFIPPIRRFRISTRQQDK